MRPPRKTLPALLAAVLVATLLAVLGQATPASADPVPPTNYSPVDVSDISPGDSYIYTRTHPDGDVTVARACSTASSAYAFKTFTGNGSNAQSRPAYPYGDPNYFPAYCGMGSVVGVDGTIYFAASFSSSQGGILAFKNDQLVWSYVSNCGQYWWVKAMTVGVGGNLYIVSEGGNNNPGCSGNRLIGLTPTAQNGTPQVVLNVQLSGWTPFGGIAAYDSGLALFRSGNKVQYVGYDGTLGTTISYTNGASNYAGYREELQATLSGRVFIAHKADSATSAGCTTPNYVTGSISAVEPTGTIWTKPLPACSYVNEVAPTPQGGVVAQIDYASAGSSQKARNLVAFDSEGNQIWTQPFGNAGFSQEYAVNNLHFVADLNGNIAVQRHLEVRKFINGSSHKFHEVQFGVLSGVTGELLPGTQVMLRGDYSTSSGPSYKASDWIVRITNGTVYIVARECTTTSYCLPDSDKLYAFPIPGLQMDYPRGAILKYDEPWKDYAAAGDSFSAIDGQSGNPSCYRGEGAYPNLLNGNPALRLNLTTYVACSGATPADIAEQAQSLDEDTDVATLTGGGNAEDEHGFKQFIGKCLLLDCGDPVVNNVFFQRIAFQLSDELEDAYQATATNAPNAKVYVLGYPQVLPPTVNSQSPCMHVDAWMWAFDQAVKEARDGSVTATLLVTSVGQELGLTQQEIEQGIAAGVAEFNAAEVAAARLLVFKLNEKIEETVDGLNNSNFTYVDPLAANSPFTGHELCTDDPYFTAIDPINQYNSFHLNQAGMGAYSHLAVTAMAANF